MMLKYIKALEPLTSRVRTDVSALKRNGKTIWTTEPLTHDILTQHVTGGRARGVCPIKAGEKTTRVAVLDLDSHKGETPWAEMVSVAEAVVFELKRHGLKPIPFRSFGGMGMHIFMIWDEPQDAYSVRRFISNIIGAVGYKNGAAGVAKNQIEIFPKQDSVSRFGFGNQFILPLAKAGKSEPLDPDLHFIPAGRDYALTMEWPVSHPVPQVKKEPIIINVQAGGYEENLSPIVEMLPYIEPDIDYDDWIKVGMAIHFETNGSDNGLNLWDAWSAGSLKSKGSQGAGKYNGYEETEARWGSFKSGLEKPVTIRTIKRLAHQGGWNGAAQIDFQNLDKVDNNPSDRFRVIPAAEFAKGERPQWHIKGVLPKAGLAMIYGPSGSAKTFLILDLIISIARGIDWCGRKVKQGRVVYIAAEGVGGVRNRLNAYANHHDISLDELLVGIISDTPDLRTEDHELLARQINDAGGAAVIVVDTLAQASQGGNENASEDMGKVINRCKLLHELTGALVLLVHHSGKDATRGSRGWSGIKGALDAEIEVIYDKEKGQRKAQITKQKDGESGAEFYFTLHNVVLGKDEDGDSVTSCVVEHQDVPVFVDCSRPTGKWQKLFYSSACDLISVSDTSIPLEDVISEALKRDPKNKGADPKNSERDRRRDCVLRAADDLHRNGIINLENDSVSLPQTHETPQSG